MANHIKDIALDISCKNLFVDRDMVLSKSRKEEYVTARHLAMYLIKSMDVFSHAVISRVFGLCDNTGSRYATSNIGNRMDQSKVFYMMVKKAEREFMDTLMYSCGIKEANVFVVMERIRRITNSGFVIRNADWQFIVRHLQNKT